MVMFKLYTLMEASVGTPGAYTGSIDDVASLPYIGAVVSRVVGWLTLLATSTSLEFQKVSTR